MAVRHGYGKIAGADALIFAYDTGDTRNSYKGEPTTNIVTNPTFLGTPNTQISAIADNWYFSGDTSATGFRFYDSATAPIPLKFPNEGAVVTTGPNGTTNRRIYYNGTVEPNTTYTLSYWLYSSAFGSISNYFFTYKADGTGTTSPSYGQGFTTGQWVFIQQSFTTPADTGNTRNVNWGPVISAGTNSLFAMQRFQIEAKSHATQFVNGTRSATQGLLDLTGNSSIDLSNVSFDSNAQITFDGTNDSITAIFTGFNSAYYSLEYIINPDTNVNYNQTIGLGNSSLVEWGTFLVHSSLDGSLFCGTDVATRFINSNLPQIYSNGVAVHCVFTFNNGAASFYKNGTLIASKSMNLSAQSTFDRIFLSTTLDGYLPATKIYNRALTADEIRNNYRHYKTRFNI